MNTQTTKHANDKIPFWKNQKYRRILTDTVTHIFLALMAAIWILPVVWVFLESFNKNTAAYQPTFFPTEYTFNNYIQLFTETSVMNFLACL